MKASQWLYLAFAVCAALALFVSWPFAIVGVGLGIGGYYQRKSEQKAALAARYAHTRR